MKKRVTLTEKSVLVVEFIGRELELQNVSGPAYFFCTDFNATDIFAALCGNEFNSERLALSSHHLAHRELAGADDVVFAQVFTCGVAVNDDDTDVLHHFKLEGRFELLCPRGFLCVIDCFSPPNFSPVAGRTLCFVKVDYRKRICVAEGVKIRKSFGTV